MSDIFEPTKLAGTFRARCRKTAWLPAHEVLSWPREDQPDTTSVRHDSRKGQLLGVPCHFDTEDPEALVAHMAQVHGAKLAPHRQLELGKGNWKAPALSRREGVAYVPAKRVAAAFDVRTCEACGLTAQVDDVQGRRWCADHLSACVAVEIAS